MDADGDGALDGFGPGFGGHDSHDAYGNADFDGAGHQTMDALAIGFDHASGSSTGGEGDETHCADATSGAAHDYHSHAGVAGHAAHDNNRCDVPPGMRRGPERRIYAVHVVGHGWVDIVGELTRIARQYDVIRIDPFRPSMDSTDMTLNQLADDEPWNPPYQVEKNPPPGWYPGATGTTRLRRQVWQVGKRDSLFDQGLVYGLRKLRRHEWYKDPQYDKDAKTYFDVSIATWRYDETTDYETLIVFRIASTRIWHARLGIYGYKKEPFLKHQAAAEAIQRDLLELLKQAAPTEAARSLRAMYAGKTNEHGHGHPGSETGEGKGADQAPDSHHNPTPTPTPTPTPVPTTPTPVPTPDMTPAPGGGECPDVTADGAVLLSGADLDWLLLAQPEPPPGVKPLKRVDIVVTLPV